MSLPPRPRCRRAPSRPCPGRAALSPRQVRPSSASCPWPCSCPALTCSSSTWRSPISAASTAGTSLSSLSWVLNGVHDRLRRHPGPGGPVGRPGRAPPASSSPAWSRFSVGLAAVRPFARSRRADRRPGHPGGRRGPDGARLAVAAAGRRPGRGPVAGHRHLVRARRSRCRARPGDRRRAWSSSAGGGCSGSTCPSGWSRSLLAARVVPESKDESAAGGRTWPGPACWRPRSAWSPWPWSRRRPGAGARPASSACCSPRWPAARPWCSARAGTIRRSSSSGCSARGPSAGASPRPSSTTPPSGRSCSARSSS